MRFVRRGRVGTVSTAWLPVEGSAQRVPGCVVIGEIEEIVDSDSCAVSLVLADRAGGLVAKTRHCRDWDNCAGQSSTMLICRAA